mgnify:CR=1 FL=1
MQEENSESGLPTAEEINEMLARHDGEKELFDRIDMEEDARLRKAGFVSAAQACCHRFPFSFFVIPRNMLNTLDL